MICQIKIYIYTGKTFPGKLSPRPPMIEPRRMELPPDFADKWKKIGSKRSKFDTLGLPVPPVDKFPRHKPILVREAGLHVYNE